MAIDWTEAHAREAMRYLLRMADEAVGAGDVDPADPRMIAFDDDDVVDEDGFCTALNSWEVDPAPALRRVDGLATGRLVRETVWRVRYFCDDGRRGGTTVDLTHEEAVATRERMRRESGWRGVLVRVTRIRRA